MTSRVDACDKFIYIYIYIYIYTVTSAARILKEFREHGVCLVFWIEYYLSVCRLLNIELAEGYFFRATNRGRTVSPRPFLGSAVKNRLCKYLTVTKLVNFLRCSIENSAHLSLVNRYILVRDAVFFTVNFLPGIVLRV